MNRCENISGTLENRQRRGRLACAIPLLLALAFGGAGCSSIYHRTRALLPPDPLAQLKLRVDEAHRAEQLAQHAGVRLRDRLKQGMRGEATEVDIDRVEAAAFEFERRVASARDAAERCKEQNQLTGELERLGRLSRELMECVQPLRGADPSVAAGQLDVFLNGARKP